MTTKTQGIAFLLHVLFLVGIYGAKVITAVLLDIFFLFLAYSVIYSHVSFLMRLIQIIKKPLILSIILLHLYGVAITRLAEGYTPLLWSRLLLLLLLRVL